MLVKAATAIQLTLDNGTKIELDGASKTISIELSEGTKYWHGSKLGAYVELTEEHMMFDADGASWETKIDGDNATSVMKAPTVTLEATDDGWAVQRTGSLPVVDPLTVMVVGTFTTMIGRAM